MIILLFFYALGYLVAFSMLRIEHEAEGKTYTKGDRFASILLSVFSWAMVLFSLIVGWFQRIKALGYWAKPVKPETK